MFYMRNFCWEHMVDYPVKDYNNTSENIQVYDSTKYEDVKDLTFIKIFPYVLMAYCLAMTLPYLIWSSASAENVKIQIDFLMSGFEEGLTMTIGGLAKMMDNNASLEETQKETRVYNGLERELKKVP